MAFDKSKTLEAAEKYIGKGQYEKAIREFQKITDVDPSDDRVLLRTAYCYEESGNDNEAAQIYRKVAANYQNEGLYQKALATLKQAQRKQPNDVELAMNMAELYYVQGLPHEAMSLLEKCLEQSKDNHFVYGGVLQLMVRVDSENIQIRTQLGQFLFDEGDVEGAKRQYSLALAQLLSKERYVDYIQLARKYFKISPNDKDVTQELANIYIKMKRYDDALALVNALPQKELTPELREILVTCYTQKRQFGKAVWELKTIAKQYKEEGKRDDIVEEVWRRAQELAPNDSEIAEALGDEIPPMLSESALKVMPRSNVQAVIPPISDSERVLSQMFMQAMEAYRQGNVENARMLCHQIVDNNERHLPALQLLSQIYESSYNNAALAQVERKLARAVFDNDPNEAIRHVLKAERANPRAWENFNLMLVFGLNPSDYGMSAPESSSNPRISQAMYAQTPGLQPPPNMPPSAAGMNPNTRTAARPPAAPPLPAGAPPIPGKPPKPTIPPPGPARQRAATLLPEQSAELILSSVGQSAVRTPNAQGLPYNRASGIRPVVPPPVSNVPPVPATPQFDRAPSAVRPISGQMPAASVPQGTPGVRTIRPKSMFMPDEAFYAGSGSSAQQSQLGNADQAIDQLSSAVSDSLDDAFDAMFQGSDQNANNQPQTPSAANSHLGNSNPSNSSLGMRRNPADSAAVSAHDRPKVSYSKLPAVEKPANVRKRPPSIVMANADFATPKAQAAVPHPVSTSTMNARPVVTSAQPDAIPESELQRVTEAIQEVEFYVSLALIDDARNMLNTLIQEFGDVGIIHDEKVKLDAL